MSPTATMEASQGASPAVPRPDGCAIGIRGLQHFFGEGELRKQVLFDNTSKWRQARSSS